LVGCSQLREEKNKPSGEKKSRETVIGFGKSGKGQGRGRRDVKPLDLEALGLLLGLRGSLKPQWK